jgi:hypothetical protein
MPKGKTLTAGKWNETESNEYNRAAKMYDPVLRFLKKLQEENDGIERDSPQAACREGSQQEGAAQQEDSNPW